MSRWLLLLLAQVGILAADPISLIRIGEPWRFLRTTAEPSDPLLAWTQLQFDDSSWATGPSGFSLGYSGYSSEATALPYTGLDETAVFFRKRFSVADTNTIRWLVLRVDYDDGFVAYLNGLELARRNLPGPPGSPVPRTTFATPHFKGATEEIDLSSSIPLLQTGDNILAIQLHKSAEFDWSLGLVPELLANFNRGPFLQNATTRSIQIIWRTPLSASSTVEFGRTPDLGASVYDTNLVTTHALTVDGLEPNTTYFYRVRSATPSQQVASPIESFRTLKTSGPLTFAVLGDSGLGSIATYQIAQLLRDIQPDLVVHAGDIVYPAFTLPLADARCLSVYRPQMKNAPFFFAIGNHDIYGIGSAVDSGPYLDTFYLPTNTVPPAIHAAAGTSPEHYYSFDHGDAHFAVLYVPMLHQYSPQIGDPQYQWLENDLAASPKPWKFLFMHHPLRSSSYHGRDDYNGNGALDRQDVSAVFLPLAARYGVQVIFTAHDHDFERFAPTNGVHIVVTGGGGGALYSLVDRDPISAQFYSVYHAVHVTIQNDTLALCAIAPNGQIVDSMVVQRAPVPTNAFLATWHTPHIEPQPANDSDGNILGQSFDFIGASIPTLSGFFSNLGLFYLNHDSNTLFLGLAHTMIPSDAAIFLFLQTPRSQGVTHLTLAGNDQLDPTAQAVDGLDALTLSFTNFAPNIACVLGDEWADAPSRNFTRPNGFPFGQGIFFLDPALSDVPGIRLQQFNRSPQLAPVTGEQNADFIEIAIPAAAFGELRPGDHLKIGAVVAATFPQTNLPPLAVDRGFLGASLSTNPLILEPIDVQLAPDPDPDHDGLDTQLELALGTNPENPDTDGDGLNDGWELQFGFNPLSTTPSGERDDDPDNDLAPNYSEQIAGTNPRDPRSALRIRISRSLQGRVRISWPTAPGRQYYLQSSADPKTGFVDVAHPEFPLRASSPLADFEHDLASPAAIRYYRLRLVIPQP